jgi:hypothetical protein
MLHLRLLFVVLFVLSTFILANRPSQPLAAQAEPQQLSLSSQELHIDNMPVGGMPLLSANYHETILFDAISVDDTVYGVGYFDQFAPVNVHLAMYDPVQDTLLNGVAIPQNGEVTTIVSDNRGGWYIGGDFTSVNNVPRGGLAHIYPDYSLDPLWSPERKGTLVGFVVHEDILYVASYIFDNVGAVSFLTAYNREGGEYWQHTVNGLITAMISNGKALYISGDFTQVGNSPQQDIAQITFDGFVNTSNIQIQANQYGYSSVQHITIISDTLYFTGEFSAVNQLPRTNIAAVYLSDYQVASWQPEIAGVVEGLYTANNQFYLFGDFTSIDDQPRDSIAAFSATGELTDFQPPSLAYRIESVVAHGNNIYIVSPGLEQVANQAHQNIAVLNAYTGQLQPKPSVQFYSAASVQGIESVATNGDVIALGGVFSLYGKAADRAGVFAIDTTTGLLTPWQVDLPFYARELTANETTLFVAATNELTGFDLMTGERISWSIPSLSYNNVHTMAANERSVFINGNSIDKSMIEIDIHDGSFTAWDIKLANGNKVTVSKALVNNDTLYAFLHSIDFTGLAAFSVMDRSMLWSMPGYFTSMAYNDDTLYVGGYFEATELQERNSFVALNAYTGEVLPPIFEMPNESYYDYIDVKNISVANGFITAAVPSMNVGYRVMIWSILGGEPLWSIDVWTHGIVVPVLSADSLFVGGTFSFIGSYIRDGGSALFRFNLPPFTYPPTPAPSPTIAVLPTSTPTDLPTSTTIPDASPLPTQSPTPTMTAPTVSNDRSWLWLPVIIETKRE